MSEEAEGGGGGRGDRSGGAGDVSFLVLGFLEFSGNYIYISGNGRKTVRERTDPIQFNSKTGLAYLTEPGNWTG